MNKQTRTLLTVTSSLIIAVLFLAVAIRPAPVRADLPPRPTPIIDTPPSYNAPPGSRIRLQAEFAPAWPWREIHWQTPWTQVQWQDDRGVWHDVEGWQGEFDDVTLDPDGLVTGEKTWWLARENQGTGPFRWLVTLGRDGDRLATSAPFDLPEVDGQLKTITVSLTVPRTY
jgi:hypothetical protein